MGIAVREAMHIGGLARCKVVAGADGLDRTIEAVTVMEVPDVIRWLKGNVLLLTSLYPVKDDEEAIESLVHRLHMAGTAGRAIKTGQYVRQIPDAIIAAGNRLGLPIIEIDKETTYLDIMTPLMEHILSEPRPLEEQPDSYNQWLTELAMSGKGVAALIQAVERLTGSELSVGTELPAPELRYGTEAAPLTVLQKKQLTAAKRPVRMERRFGGQALPCLVAPIMLNEELVGDITYRASNREFRERDMRVVERTMILIALEFLKAMTTADVEQTFKDQFMADVPGAGPGRRGDDREGPPLRLGLHVALCRLLRRRQPSGRQRRAPDPRDGGQPAMEAEAAAPSARRLSLRRSRRRHYVLEAGYGYPVSAGLPAGQANRRAAGRSNPQTA